MAGPLAVGQQVLYERIATRAGRVVRVEHTDSAGAAYGSAGAGRATGIASLLAGNNLIIILWPAAAVIAPAGFYSLIVPLTFGQLKKGRLWGRDKKLVKSFAVPKEMRTFADDNQSNQIGWQRRNKNGTSIPIPTSDSRSCSVRR